MIETLQSLRFIFFVMIFMSHFGYDGRPTFDAGGDCGVSFFFILSGFVGEPSYTGMLTLCAATTLLAATLALKIGAEQRAKSEE
ncbi:MAG: hypothetical protein IJ355_07030 [Prevotella sp.]|nr:hypothetical protein [Prevotella sp.]